MGRRERDYIYNDFIILYIAAFGYIDIYLYYALYIYIYLFFIFFYFNFNFIFLNFIRITIIGHVAYKNGTEGGNLRFSKGRGARSYLFSDKITIIIIIIIIIIPYSVFTWGEEW